MITIDAIIGDTMEAIASEKIEQNAVVQIIGNSCSTVTSTDQFLTPSSAIFNAAKQYKKGEVVFFDPPKFSDLVDSEISSIKKLMSIEPKLTASKKRIVRKLISRKATNLYGA